MSGYLARLVQRASGRSLTTSAGPAARAPQPVGDARDPFETTVPLTPATPPPARAVPREFTESPVQAKSPDVLQDRAEHIELRPTSHFAPPPLSLRPKTIPPPEASASPVPFRDSPIPAAPPVVEHAIVERETIRQVRETAKLAPPEPFVPRPAEHAGPLVEKSPAKTERLAPAPPPVLNSTAPLRPPAPFRIEPARKERPAPPPPVAQPADEPRLVIGQMKVEIIPAAPTPPMRASSRPRPRSQSTGSAASSRSQFGLGQM